MAPRDLITMFPEIEPHQSGMDSPFYVQGISCSPPERSSAVWLRAGAVILVGSWGALLYTSPLHLWDAMGSPCGQDEGLNTSLPTDGWGLAWAECWQTGGMCMVDALAFKNGFTLTLNDEYAVLWAAGVEVLGDDAPAFSLALKIHARESK